MTNEEHLSLIANNADKELTKIAGRDLKDPLRDRTLIYGYDVNRLTFHLYLQTGTIHRIIYNGSTNAIYEDFDYGEFYLADCLPNKRVYPEACDFGFCQLLKKAGFTTPFTTYGALARLRDPSPFIGKIRENFGP